MSDTWHTLRVDLNESAVNLDGWEMLKVRTRRSH
jgi:hypothetical protein